MKILTMVVIFFLQMVIIGYGFGVVISPDTSEWLKTVWIGIILFNVVFGALNIRNLFRF